MENETAGRKQGPRKRPEDHPSCPHCGGRIHFSTARAGVNFECMWRQFCVERGTMEDPYARMPVFTAEDLPEFAVWAQEAGDELTYGIMPAESGAATYAGLRSSERRERESQPEPPPQAEKPKRSRRSKKEQATESTPTRLDDYYVGGQIRTDPDPGTEPGLGVDPSTGYEYGSIDDLTDPSPVGEASIPRT